MIRLLNILFAIKHYGKFLTITGLILTGVSTLFSQNPNPAYKSLVGQFESSAKNNAREMIYIQTSKGVYETSEDVWFKAYMLNAQYLAPSLLSKTLYVQLLNESTRKAVWEGKYEINNGFADGQFYLQDSLPDGNYLLSAFTQHSLLANNEELKAVRRIIIKKEVKPQLAAVPDTSAKPDTKQPIQFATFPEGGNLIDGIESKLAFKAVGSNGLPVEVEGTLLEDSMPLVKFKSSHAGMGKLSFTPLIGKKYQIQLSNAITDSVFFLPQVLTQGITLQLTKRDKEFMEFRVSQSPTLPQRTIYLRAQLRGIVCFMGTANLSRELNIKIPIKEFPFQGIAEFTLFNDSLLPVAERLVYVNPEKKLTVEAQLDKERYPTRGKALLRIKVTDDNGQPVVANLGVNVYDKLYRNADDPVNILSHCNLSSQLKGKIYNPAYYFDTKNKDREDALDLLLLTQGWRRYVWAEEALQANKGKNQTVVFDSIKGKVFATKRTKQAKGVQQFVEVSNPGKNIRSYLIAADSTGIFKVAPIHLSAWQGDYVYLKPRANEEFKPRINIEEPFDTINEVIKLKAINYPLSSIIAQKPDNSINPLVEGRGTIKLAEVTVKGRGTTTFRDKYLGYLDSIAKSEATLDYVCIGGTLNCPFHKLDRSKKPVHKKTYNVKLGPNGEALGPNWNHYYYFGDVDRVYINPSLDFTEKELLEMNNLSRIRAYQIHHEFYEPKYDNVDLLNLPIPDSRNTLLWKPMIVTNEKGEASLEFFCSDINTGFVGIIEGVSGKGLLGTSNFEFIVCKPLLRK
jgi:hypothetical protein